MVYGTYNELVIGAFVNQLITRGPHIVDDFPSYKPPFSSMIFPRCYH